MTTTHADVTHLVTDILEANGTEVAAADDYNIESIVQTLYSLHGSWDAAAAVLHTPHDEQFWEIVAENATDLYQYETFRGPIDLRELSSRDLEDLRAEAGTYGDNQAVDTITTILNGRYTA